MTSEVVALKRRVDKLSSLLDVAKGMAAERDLTQLLQLILKEARQTVEAERCSLFIVDQVRGELWSKIAHGLEIKEIRIPIGVGLAGYVAETGEQLNIADAYDDPRFDRSWDSKTGYRTRAMLCVPMVNTQRQIAGVIQAINKVGGGEFTQDDQELLMALGAQAASAVENAILNDEIDRLFEGFVKASVTAIESRDPTTSGHSERVAVLTLGIAEHLPRSGIPEYKRVHFSPTELKEIRYAALLHDFGKVGVREHVLVKANKLLPLELDVLQHRFAFIKRTLELEAVKRKFNLVVAAGLRGHEPELAAIDGQLELQLRELDEFIGFIQQCNRPTVLTEGSFERLHDIQARTFVNMDGVSQPILSDSEVEFLSVRRGSLTPAERSEIESHVVHTYRFLSQIPWTRELRRVPVIAYAHHEKLDGLGYPRKLFDEEIPMQSKMMTVADIYDALTASDRPYKKAMPHERAVDILHEEAKAGQVDRELLRIFVEARVHEALSRVRPVELLSSRLHDVVAGTAPTPVAGVAALPEAAKRSAKPPTDKRPKPTRDKKTDKVKRRA